MLVTFCFLVQYLLFIKETQKISCCFNPLAKLTLYKNIIDRDTVNVHSDYRVYATELINFLSVIITTRVKNKIAKIELNKKNSYKLVFKYLSKYKKVRTTEDGHWETATMLKYIKKMTGTLGV